MSDGENGSPDDESRAKHPRTPRKRPGSKKGWGAPEATVSLGAADQLLPEGTSPEEPAETSQEASDDSGWARGVGSISVVGAPPAVGAQAADPTISPEARLYQALLALHENPLTSPEKLVYGFLRSMAGLLRVGYATCVVAPLIDSLPKGDPLHGYRPLRIYMGDPAGSRSAQIVEQWSEVPTRFLSEPPMIDTTARAGRHRVVLLREQVDVAKDGIPPLMEQMGNVDMITTTYSLHPAVEVHYVCSRPAELFTEEDRRLMLRALEGLGTFSARFAAFHGFLPGQTPLQPRERSVLEALLGPCSEKEIADHLGMAVGSLHQYVVRVYRKCGVRSRAELLAWWIAPTGGSCSACYRSVTLPTEAHPG